MNGVRCQLENIFNTKKIIIVFVGKFNGILLTYIWRLAYMHEDEEVVESVTPKVTL